MAQIPKKPTDDQVKAATLYGLPQHSALAFGKKHVRIIHSFDPKAHFTEPTSMRAVKILAAHIWHQNNQSQNL